ncbi:hypothetical protein A33M_2971 [Rhodovulum sp. PH10]|uniref:BrnT family toxin n=1 Tax=Rhodovulum sp. PH10 TaxID=1187851 RepID=UPI00027C2C40|nr:BrnT family toxin [Rhodovulum sp. PH10]EJW11612.1 hypothetical protein A33M_2971 [Rhodovulum sp. PH10]
MPLLFDWDPAKAASNLVKHGVAFDEAMTVFRDPLALSVLDPDSADEERWITLGSAATGNLLLVVHTWADIGRHRTVVRIISARRPTRNEAQRYREEPPT